MQASVSHAEVRRRRSMTGLRNGIGRLDRAFAAIAAAQLAENSGGF
jgi:hypothetical protein